MHTKPFVFNVAMSLRVRMDKPILTPEERREKRAARREKQRLNNVLRADKMHKLRINAISPLRPQVAIAKTTGYHIGCSGWFYWDWRKIFYPEGMATKDWFDHYASIFKTVELNASFYSWPTEATVKTWLKQAGRKKFIYTVKVCELITHIKRFVDTAELVKDFTYIADILGNRMGCFLYQLPPSFDYTPTRLQTIMAQLPQGQKNVVEFRHETWWNDTVYDAFKKAGIIFCSCSAPRLPDELIKTAEQIYIRFHGKTAWYRYDYSDDELKEWADRIKEANAKEVWIYFNNDFGGNAIKNSKTMASLLETKL